MEQTKAIKEAVEKIGSQSKLASAIGVSPAFMHQVFIGKKTLPDRYCRKVEDVTGISRKRLTSNWSDYWPELADDS